MDMAKHNKNVDGFFKEKLDDHAAAAAPKASKQEGVNPLAAKEASPVAAPPKKDKSKRSLIIYIIVCAIIFAGLIAVTIQELS
jgi:hypothetical protein